MRQLSLASVEALSGTSDCCCCRADKSHLSLQWSRVNTIFIAKLHSFYRQKVEIYIRLSFNSCITLVQLFSRETDIQKSMSFYCILKQNLKMHFSFTDPPTSEQCEQCTLLHCIIIIISSIAKGETWVHVPRRSWKFFQSRPL